MNENMNRQVSATKETWLWAYAKVGNFANSERNVNENCKEAGFYNYVDRKSLATLFVNEV